jgi:hypothetical protein
MPQPWHFTTWPDALDHWQTIIAGLLAFAAGFGTVLATIAVARRQITDAREDADRVIAASQAQTAVAQKQIETTIYFARMREAAESMAFVTMLEAAMGRVLAEAAWAKMSYAPILAQTAGSSTDAFAVRQCITKGAFAELRGEYLRQGGPLTREFLDLEREIDSFAAQWEDGQSVSGVPIRNGKHAWLGQQLAGIEAKATELRDRAVRLGFELAEAAVQLDPPD